MNKKLLTLILFTFLAITNSKAQNLRLGGGLSYGTVIKNAGLNFRGDVKFHKQWSIAPHFNWFYNKNNGPISKRWNALNIDGHYYFEVEPTWTIYPVFGINIASVSEKANGITFSNSDVGINLGFGSEYNFDRRLSGFGEIKYVISDADQAVITLGVLYQITE